MDSFGASVLETSLLVPAPQHLLLQFLTHTYWLVHKAPRKALAREGVFVSERPEKKEIMTCAATDSFQVA